MDNIKTAALADYGREAAKNIENYGFTTAFAEIRRIRRSFHSIHALAQNESASDWYTDNLWMAQRAAAQAEDAFRKSGLLRRKSGMSAVTALAGDFLDAGEYSPERLCAFLRGARQDELFSEKESCLFGAGLRAALLHLLSEERSEDNARRCFSALRQLADTDMGETLEKSDPVNAVFMQDKIYPLMDVQSRAEYRRVLRRLAKKSGEQPTALALRCLNDGLHRTLFPEKKRREGLFAALYFFSALLLTVILGITGCQGVKALLLLLPAMALIYSLLFSLISHLVPPRRLLRLELEDGVGAEGRTVCAVFALLTTPESGEALAKRLSYFKLCNRDCGENLLFALVADLPESAQRPSADSEAIHRTAQAVEALNEKYGGGFFLLTREPVYNERERLWMPRERKRGAMEELARLLCHKPSALHCVAGDGKALYGRYFLALDSDSYLTPGSARRLIGAALHPLNRPVIENGTVRAGHGLIHPRMSTELDCAMATDFARIHSGQGGTDSYGCLQQEALFDLFDRGGFYGKGLIDAGCYLVCMEGRLPENRVLSHDTLEGAYLRGAYMSDTELTDTAPTDAPGWFRRASRWIRGDWQNLPWLLHRELSPIERFRIFDNLRRSLTPAATLAAIVSGLWLPAFRFCAVFAFISMACVVILQSIEQLFVRRRDAVLRCRSAVLRGIGGALVRLNSDLLLLPWNAFCGLFSAATALWRMLISKRHLLAWSVGTQRHVFSPALLCSMLSGLILLLFCPGSLGKAVGLIWLATPLFTLASGWERKPKAELSETEKNFLQNEAAAIWQYFARFCNPSEHFLPPDNFQVQPPKGPAHRTSPTNIGLALLSCLCALDMQLCPQDEALTLAENMLSAIEALPKWRGHLYNWYDTSAAVPLQPLYVSAVDSGNLLACLIAAKNGFSEYGRPDLAARISALCGEMDFSALYDRQRHLFHIGLDPLRGTYSDAHYDLLASEVRLTGFLTVARGDVPLRHWASLGRAQVSLDGWRGLVSWSGSVFEYLMPELFLPLFKGSLLWETARFCLYAQRQHARRRHAPWGNSESAYFSVDAALDWRYKAHGTGALALSPDMDSESVVAPYASFLALCVHPKAALSNLRLLTAKGMHGQFGFYDALDTTPGRAAAGGSPVPCFMAHHLGMSLAAINNCLCASAVRRRFMAEDFCAAYTGLLQQRVPLGGSLLRRDKGSSRHPALHTEHSPVTPFVLSSADEEQTFPAFFPLSNGVYSLLAGDDGYCRAVSDGVLMYRPDSFRLLADGAPLLPGSGQPGDFSRTYSRGTLRFTTKSGQSICSSSISAAASERGELRHIIAGEGAVLTLEFEPALAFYDDWRSHPAFWSLGLCCSVRQGCIFIQRLSRGKLPELWLCLAATVPLSVTRGLGWQMLGPVRLQAVLPDGGCADLALAFSHSQPEALASARKILSEGAADMAGTMAALLGIGADDMAECFRLCTALAKPRVMANPACTKQALWKHGISGDIPLYYTDASGPFSQAAKAIQYHALLTACGLCYDLVLDSGEDGEYMQPRAQALRRYMERYGLSSFENSRGGLHFASDTVLKASSVLPAKACKTKAQAPSPCGKRGTDVPPFHYCADDSFCFETVPLPPRAWQNIIANGKFGFIATDCGTGHLWRENAREQQISAWENNPLSCRGCETLERIGSRGRRSMMADGLSACRITYGFGWARWERSGSSATVFVPADRAVRILLAEGDDTDDILWHLRLRMAAEERDAAFVITREKDGILYALNPRSPGLGVFKAAASAPFSAFTCDEAAYEALDLAGQGGAGYEPCFAMRFAGGSPLVIVCGFEDDEVMRALAEPKRAFDELRRVRDRWRSLLGRLRVKTDCPELDKMLNGWAAYQAIAGRILGRSSIYQSGGAFGFRDQLQDAANMLMLTPKLCKKQILLCCRRQFTQGDVLHWWHEDGGSLRGVRTRCSDDLLWLPWALCEYTEKTGDLTICEIKTPWLTAEPLRKDENDRYFTPPESNEADSVLCHALRAMEAARARGTGAHGLLRMGSGDWNDGMDQVRGESVWLTLFYAHTAQRLAALVSKLGTAGSVELRNSAASCLAAVEKAWDGNWYRRGYWPDGTPLGSAESPECALDSISQSWAAFCPGLEPEHVSRALHSAYDKLRDEAHGITKLFTPPFCGEGPEPGYIRSCGPGFRENGGQYTHGALWLASAMLRTGMTDEGAAILLDTLPARHKPAHWAAEPYVLAADVSANDDHYGEANWSWYTGSAGWFFRVALEDYLGIRLQNGQISVEKPVIDYEANLNGRRITVKDGKAVIE